MTIGLSITNPAAKRTSRRLRFIPPTGTKKHHADGPEADHASKVKLDHPMGALQLRWARSDLRARPQVLGRNEKRKQNDN